MVATKRPLRQEKPNGEFELPPSASPRKKQKSSDALNVQKVNELDVITISGIDVEEEQEQLLSRPTKRSHISPSTLRIEEEEAATILQKIPLERKLKEITSKCGIMSISTDIEHCLSQAVEELMHRLIHNMIWVSNKRLVEKSDHDIHVTSDIQHEILPMNQTVEYKEKQQEYQGVDVEKVANKTTQAAAANVAAGAAVGGKDLASKWKLMAKKVKQKLDTSAQPNKKIAHNNHQESQEGTSGVRDIFAEPQKMVKSISIQDATAEPQKMAKSISIQDAIAVLEREPQMMKSTQLHCLHERFKAKTNAI